MPAPGAAPAAGALRSAILLCWSSSSLASFSARSRSAARSARWRSLSWRSCMIILGPLIPDGEPVCAGGAVGLVVEEENPLVTAGCPPTPRISAIEAFSSSRSGVNGLGYLSASSSAQRIALWVCLEMCKAGCADARSKRGEDEVLGGMRDAGRVVESASNGSLSRS